VLGLAMAILSLLIYLPPKIILVIGFLIVLDTYWTISMQLATA
jgi:hypothetical protein